MKQSMKQLYLKIREGEPPVLALGDEPQPGEGVPADMVPLPGATVVATSRFNRCSSRQACDRIAELCQRGVTATVSNESVVVCANMAADLMADVLGYVRGRTELSRSAAEVLARAVLDSINAVRTGLAHDDSVVPGEETQPPATTTTGPQEPQEPHPQWSPNSVPSAQDSGGEGWHGEES